MGNWNDRSRFSVGGQTGPVLGERRIVSGEKVYPLSTRLGVRLRFVRVGRYPVAAAQDGALPEWRPTGGGERRHVGGQAQVAQVPGHVLGVLHERDKSHFAAATGTRLDVNFEASGHQLVPRAIATAVRGRGWSLGCVVSRRQRMATRCGGGTMCGLILLFDARTPP